MFKVHVQFSQNSQENNCASVSYLTKLPTWDLGLYLNNFFKKDKQFFLQSTSVTASVLLFT